MRPRDADDAGVVGLGGGSDGIGGDEVVGGGGAAVPKQATKRGFGAFTNPAEARWKRAR